MGRIGDPRAGDALEHLRRHRLTKRGNEMVTLNVLRVLAYADRR